MTAADGLAAVAPAPAAGQGTSSPATPGGDPLATPLADAASVALFGLAGALLARSSVAGLLLGPPAREALAAAVALLGPLGAGIERGRARPVGWGGGLLLGLGAGASALAAWAATGDLARSGPGFSALFLAVVTLGGALLARRLGPRLDREEAAWRAAVRQGPPDGGSPLADWIAARRLPAPWRLLLLPLDLPARLLLLAAVRTYQLTASRLMPPACRFEPTCSRYGFHALWRHGAVRGSLLTALRLVRCSPLTPGGFDPVPPRALAEAGRWAAVSSPPLTPPRPAAASLPEGPR